jgi:hypothetical protein
VVAASGSAKGYQWQFNSTNLPGETVPMLAFDQPDSSQAGPYQVIVTNETGAVTSQVANLWITANDTASRLSTASAATNQFVFSLIGEVGRRYRILSSTNLGNWWPEVSFPMPYWPGQASVVFDWTGADGFALPRTAPLKLVRAAPYHAQNEACNSHLKQTRFARLLYVYDNPSGFYNGVYVSQLTPYFKGGQILYCPSGGVYTFSGEALNPPFCSVPGHVLEEP